MIRMIILLAILNIKVDRSRFDEAPSVFIRHRGINVR
jgi:hypothetical protein